MVAETGLEEQENVVHFSDSEEFDQEHGSKKDHHFPHTNKDVGEVASRFQLLLDLAQIFDKT